MSLFDKFKIKKGVYTEPLDVGVDIDVKLVNINNYLKSIYFIINRRLPNSMEDLYTGIFYNFDKYKHLTQFTFRIEIDKSILPSLVDFLSNAECKYIFKDSGNDNYIVFIVFNGVNIVNTIKRSDQFNTVFMNIKSCIKDIDTLYFKELIENGYIDESYFNHNYIIEDSIINDIIEETIIDDNIHDNMYFIEPYRLKLMTTDIFNHFKAVDINKLYSTPLIYSYPYTDGVDYVEMLQGNVINNIHYGDIYDMVQTCTDYSNLKLDFSIPSEIYVKFIEMIERYYGSNIQSIVGNIYKIPDDESLYTEIIDE